MIAIKPLVNPPRILSNLSEGMHPYSFSKSYIKQIMNKLFLIDYENAHWCGGQLNVVVKAESAEEAQDIASDFMQDEQFNLFQDHYEEAREDGEDYSDECSYTVNSIEEFGPEHEEWQYFNDPVQSQFYPVLG